MPKGRLVLSVDEDVIKQIKIHAIIQDKTVTEIVEKLIVDYLKEFNNGK